MTAVHRGNHLGVSLANATLRSGRTLRSKVRLSGARETVPMLLERNVRLHAERPVYLEKRGGRFEAVRWEEFHAQVARLARFLHERGIGKGDRVVVLSRNAGEMLRVEFAIMSAGAIHVPLFPGYSAAQTNHLVAHSGAVAVLASDRSQLAKLERQDRVRLLVSYENIPSEERLKAFGWFRGEYGSLEEIDLADGGSGAAGGSGAGAGSGDRRGHRHGRGGGLPLGPEEIDPGQACLMMYTSGTAGELKGVLLTHENILSQQRALRRIFGLGPEDRFLSYLPWHHSFGGIFEKYSALSAAAPIAIDDSLGKDVGSLVRNWKEVRPTAYFSVPAIYLELYNHVRAHPEDAEAIFHSGIRFVFTAAVPLPAHISEFLAARTIPVIEGWGLTETSPCCTLTDPSVARTIPGMVGHPIPAVAVRLAEDGEILVRGPNVMLGYHENPEATRRVLPGDGWFRTGDLGELAGNGLRLISRKDRIFKLLNGEYVTPTPLEVCLAGANRYLRHVVVVGSGRVHTAALLFPNFTLIDEESAADREGTDRRVRESFVDTIRSVNEAHAIPFERIRAFAVVERTLTVEAGELTPSMKVRVTNVLETCGPYLDAIYEPSTDCDCSFLRKVMRVEPDGRRCLRGKDLTLDRCHECGVLEEQDTGITDGRSAC